MKKNKGPASPSQDGPASTQGGFTLIELLVVIAIIGILSAIVYASLSSAKLKSKDSAVKTQMSSMRVQAEIYYDLNGNKYTGLCTATSALRGFGGVAPGLLLDTKNATGIPSSITTIADPNGNLAGGWDKVTCHDTSIGWAVEAPTSKSISGTSSMYCVDSTKAVEEKANNLAGGAVACQ